MSLQIVQQRNLLFQLVESLTTHGFLARSAEYGRARPHASVVRVRAAEAIFNHAAKAIELEDIEARVTALEEAAGDQGKR
jgi:hypothetical protein